VQTEGGESEIRGGIFYPYIYKKKSQETLREKNYSGEL